jgi:hypothetical protein
MVLYINDFGNYIINMCIAFQIVLIIFLLIYKKTSNYNYFTFIFLFIENLFITHFLFFNNMITSVKAYVVTALFSISFCFLMYGNIYYNKWLWKKFDFIDVLVLDIKKNMRLIKNEIQKNTKRKYNK